MRAYSAARRGVEKLSRQGVELGSVAVKTPMVR